MPNTDDPTEQLIAAESADKATHQQIVGEGAVAAEQAGYASTIATNNAKQPLPGYQGAPTAAENAGAAVDDVVHRWYQNSAGAYSGVVHALSEMASAVSDLGGDADKQIASQMPAGGTRRPMLSIGGMGAADSKSIRARADAITPTIDTIGGQVAQGITQFGTSFAIGSRVAGTAKIASGLARWAANAGLGGFTQAASFNPKDQRLSDLIQSVPALKNPINDYLSSKPGDTEADGRWKNFVEGTGLSAFGDAAVEGVTRLTSWLKGARAAGSMADATRATVDATPTPVAHSEPQPGPTPATVDHQAGDIHVHEGEMTDEQLKAFEGLRSHVQTDEELGVNSQGKPGQQVREGASTDTPHPEEGRPLTVYRGSQAPLEDSHFQPENLGHATQRPSSGLGVWFTNDAEEAARYGDVAAHHLDIRNPKVYKAEDVPGFDSLGDAYRHQQELRRQGYDGITIDASHLDGPVHHVAFEPSQVREAGNHTAMSSAPTPEPKPYEPPTVTQADTAKPSTAEQPAAIPEAPPVFSPTTVAKNAISISPEKAQDFLKHFQDGRYSEIPAMLDDTHRTIPWDQLSDGANLQGVFQAMQAHFGDAIRAASGPVHVSDAAIVQLAKDIGGNVGQLQKTFSALTDQGGLAAQITAGYNMMIASARQLDDLGNIARMLDPKEPEGVKAILDFQKQLELHAAIVGQVRQSSTEIARALYAHRALKASSEVALSNISELAGTILGPKAVKKFMKDIQGGNLSDINAAADKARGKGFFSVVKEFAQHGMLSGFPTQIANLTGNASNMIIKTSERYIAGTIGEVRGVLMPDSEHATLRAAVAHTTATVSAVRDSFPLMVKALSTEQSVSASGRPVARAIYKDPTGLTGPELGLAKVINVTGQVVRYPGRLMGAIDNLNMGVGRQQDLAARIYTQSAAEADAKGLVGDARDSFLDSRQAELRANPPQTMTDASTEAGLYQSFQESARTRFGDGISTLLNSHPVVKLIVAPFVHRPLNMLRQSIMDYTVLGALSMTQREVLRAGNADTDLALARMTIGTGAIMASYEMAANGKVVGSRLGLRNTESLDNIPAHTAEIGGKWYKYDRLDPIGMWLAIGSDLHAAVQRYHDPNDPHAQADLATMTRMGIQVIGMSALDKSFMKSVDQIMQAMGQKDPVQAERLMQDVISSNAAKFVPFSGALRGVAQATDTTQRATGGDGLDNIWDSVKKGIPTLSKDLPPARDVLGRPKLIPAGASAWWNPFAGAPASSSPMDQELSKVAVSIKTPPRQIDNTVLDAHQYDEVLRNATQTKLFGGKSMNLEEYMGQVVNSSTWKKYETTDDHGVQARTKIVQGIIDSAYNYGSQKFQADHKEFRDLQIAQLKAQAQHFKPAPPAQPATP